MKFIQIKVTDKYHPKRFNRLIAIREDLNLTQVGIIIGKSIGATFEHYFLFECGDKQYVDASWLAQDLPFAGIKQLDMKKHYLKDLDNKFEYTYDTGEGYDFNCRLMAKKIDIELTDDNEGLVGRTLKGTGLGIFEDNHWCLDEYLDGKIKPGATHGNEEFEELPWNLDMEKFGDFDRELNLDEYDTFEEELEINDRNSDIYAGINDIEDKDDGKIDPYVLETFLRQEVALDIFEDVDINQKYRKLILTHDINEAYEMIVKCMIDAHHKAEEEDLDEEELDNIYYEAVEDLY